MNGLVAKQLTKKMFTICFEGNIGSGKTSCLNYLAQKYDNLMVKSEPIDKWMDFHGYNLINLLYKDINKYSFGFEHFAQLTRLQMFQNYPNMESYKGVRLMERSIYSARHCFTENLFQSGNLSKPEYIIIDEWFKWLSAKSCFKTDLIIYLRASSQTVYQRIKNRSRDEEMEIPIEYLQELHQLHDKWLLDTDRNGEETKVVTLNADLSQSELFSLLDQHLRPIYENAFI